jgi:hypothetical protein
MREVYKGADSRVELSDQLVVVLDDGRIAFRRREFVVLGVATLSIAFLLPIAVVTAVGVVVFFRVQPTAPCERRNVAIFDRGSRDY